MLFKTVSADLIAAMKARDNIKNGAKYGNKVYKGESSDIQKFHTVINKVNPPIEPPTPVKANPPPIVPVEVSKAAIPGPAK